jgi:hypothetical protein
VDLIVRGLRYSALMWWKIWWKLSNYVRISNITHYEECACLSHVTELQISMHGLYLVGSSFPIKENAKDIEGNFVVLDSNKIKNPKSLPSSKLWSSSLQECTHLTIVSAPICWLEFWVNFKVVSTELSYEGLYNLVRHRCQNILMVSSWFKNSVHEVFSD